MLRKDAIPYVSFVVDDAGCGRALGADQHAIVRSGNPDRRIDGPDTQPPCYASRLVGWQCGFEPLFVAVHSYLDVRVTDDEAEEMATDYLQERGWFGDDGPRAADYIL